MKGIDCGPRAGWIAACGRKGFSGLAESIHQQSAVIRGEFDVKGAAGIFTDPLHILQNLTAALRIAEQIQHIAVEKFQSIQGKPYTV